MNDWKGRAVFITGGTGFIGAALTSRLASLGADVHLLMRRQGAVLTPRQGWAPIAHRGDLSDMASIRLALQEAAPEIVYHLAKLEDPEADSRALAGLEAALAERRPAPVQRIRVVARGAGIARSTAGWTSLRVGTVYGPGLRADLSMEALREGAAASKEAGRFLYLDDLVEALVRVVEDPRAAGRSIAVSLDAEGQEESRRFLGWSPAIDLDKGLRLWEIARGETPGPDPGPSPSALERAARLYADRAKLHQRAGDIEAVVRDLSRAIELAPRAALFSARAAALESGGRFHEAVLDLDRAIESEPARAEFWGRRGYLHLCQRAYAQAGRDLDRAVALAPRDPGLRDWRSRQAFIESRWADAARDLEEIARIGPEPLHCALRRGQILALEGKYAQARKAASALKALPGCEAWGWLLEGYIGLASREAAAAGAFYAAEKTAGPQQGEVRAKARLYRALAGALAGRGERMKAEEKTASPAGAAAGTLYLCGMGIRVPQHLSLEGIETLQHCDVLFCNLAGDDVLEFLALFCKDIRPIAFRDENDLKSCTETLLAEVERGRRVGFMTFGNALVFGPLADRVLRESRRRGLRCRALPSISSLDFYLAESSQALGEAFEGFQVYLWSEVLNPGFVLNPHVPCIIFFGNFLRVGQVEAMASVLRAAYPAGHRCRLFGGRADNGLSADFPLAELPARLADLDIRRQIVIPSALPYAEPGSR